MVGTLDTIELYGGDARHFAGNETARPGETSADAVHVATAADQVGADDQVAKEYHSVSDDDSTATAQTVRIMCDMIREGIKDDVCKLWARRAVNAFALGQGAGGDQVSADVAAYAVPWAVFWILKHCVKYVHDEGRLFESGDGAARDRLVAPGVLFRMDEPAEDCDGFTMAACTLLQILGAPAYICAVKVDPANPERFSHVFALTRIGSELCAIDATPAGRFPGWMIPREHIFDYQIWDTEGRPVDMPLPSVYGVRQWRSRGVGDFDWNAFTQTLIKTAGQVATVAEAPTGSVIYPNTGGVMVGGGSPLAGPSVATLSASSSSALPWVVGGLIAVGLLGLVMKK